MAPVVLPASDMLKIFQTETWQPGASQGLEQSPPACLPPPGATAWPSSPSSSPVYDKASQPAVQSDLLNPQSSS